MQFSANKLQNNPNLGVGAPPRKNPGFATAVVDPGFPPGGVNSQSGCANLFFRPNCMKMKEFGPRGASLAPFLDPPLPVTNYTLIL